MESQLLVKALGYWQSIRISGIDADALNSDKPSTFVMGQRVGENEFLTGFWITAMVVSWNESGSPYQLWIKMVMHFMNQEA